MRTPADDGDSPGSPRLNPEAVPPLPGIDDIEVHYVEVRPPFWARRVEGLIDHLTGAAIWAVIGVIIGAIFATTAVTSTPAPASQPHSCSQTAPVQTENDRR
jgi:esterase/lipase